MNSVPAKTLALRTVKLFSESCKLFCRFLPKTVKSLSLFEDFCKLLVRIAKNCVILPRLS